ncbi:peptidoglycan binding protein CsiV [Enterovibrio sp. ZSDZ35]|uniref:Peptidoglycan binding protein CsiV n=1 Tax=Enterovibrio qingdaonensis TaxID=2899818 RepID=A0ABT5QPE5_9GAMM|nr:peptidoglycan binding protein CsiV [Enterovibrio sp. ZSDZ35]MDD1782862.1 peptidoglycan binding protein CsiV [Enterovibrio sp. ZSDZ35]
MKKLIFLLLCTLSLPTKAERWFDVEVIVFKRNQDPTSVKEKWPETQPNINLSNAVSVFDAVSLKERGLQLLPQSEWKLNAEYKNLSKHAGFKPLVHVAWRQNDGSRGVMPKLRFTAGPDYGKDYYLDGTPKDAPAFVANPNQGTVNVTGTDALNATNAATDTSTVPAALAAPAKESGPMYELDGFIRVYVQHYLFIETDLVLREPGERKVLKDVNAVPVPLDNQTDTETDTLMNDNAQVSTTNEGTAVTGLQKLERQYEVEKYLEPYAFKQKRRMRSGEVHYLDHPLMGLIIQVTRVEKD